MIANHFYNNKVDNVMDLVQNAFSKHLVKEIE